MPVVIDSPCRLKPPLICALTLISLIFPAHRHVVRRSLLSIGCIEDFGDAFHKRRYANDTRGMTALIAIPFDNFRKRVAGLHARRDDVILVGNTGIAMTDYTRSK